MKDTEEKIKAQVPKQLDRLDSALSDLERSIDMLSTRLQSVLRLEVFAESNPSPKEKENLVELANYINDSTQRVSNAVDTIGSLLELLEL